MSYIVEMTVKANQGLAAKGATGIVEAASRSLWPEDEPGCYSGFSGSSAGDDWTREVDRDTVALRVYRELGDDISCIEDKDEFQELGFVDALEAQFECELLDDDVSRRLSEAGLSVVSARFAKERMDERDIERVEKAGAAWDAERGLRADNKRKRADVEREHEDLKAHARILARRGTAAELDWPIDVLAEYETVAKDGVRSRLVALDAWRNDDRLDGLVNALEETAIYVRATKVDKKRSK